MNKTVPKKVPMSARDRKYYVSAAKARWDKDRERKVFALAARILRVIEKNAGSTKDKVSVEIAKAILTSPKKK